MTKNIVITGTSKGLGLVLAQDFLDQGHNVIGLSKTIPDIKSNNYTHYCVDISDSQAILKVFSKITQVDVLINNSGLFVLSDILNTSIDDIDKIISVNLIGTIYTTKIAIPLMQPGSKIIFINSVAGINQLENQSVYCASKHGLTAFAGILGKELKSREISVTSIHPGGINTTLWNESNPYPLGDSSQAMDPKIVSNTVLFIVNQNNSVDYKTITMFPKIEAH